MCAWWGCSAARPDLSGLVLDRKRQTLNHAVENEQERRLEEHRETAADRVHALFAVQLHHFLVEELTVFRAFVLLLNLLYLRLKLLHRNHRLGALHREGGQDPHNDNGQQDNGEGVVRVPAVEVLQEPRNPMENRLEDGSKEFGLWSALVGNSWSEVRERDQCREVRVDGIAATGGQQERSRAASRGGRIASTA